MRNYEIQQINGGISNRLSNYKIEANSGQDALNWLTVDDSIVLSTGNKILGVEGAVGEMRNLFFGIKNDGSKVLYAKHGSKISFWNGTALVTIVTGLTITADYTFQNYTSLAGSFTYATGIDGIFKFHNGSLGSFINMFDAAKNFKGRCFIDKARMIMVGVPNDPTGFYGSRIDAQSANYVTVTNENTGTGNGIQTVFTGTLAFKAANPRSNCFGLKITQGANNLIDDFNGIITGANLTSGTINYITGAYSLTFTTPPPNAQVITTSYQHENSNNAGITDFTKSTPRLAAEGFVVRQDVGGDAIQRVLIGTDRAYYSAKKESFYRFFIDSTDTNPTNDVFRTDIGIPSVDAAISVGIGIVFMNVANPNRPQMTLLEKNPLGDSLIPIILFDHFKFENYLYDQCVLETWDRYILISCRTKDSPVNDRLLLCDKGANTVDITHFGMRSLSVDGIQLFGGSSFAETIWQLFAEFDDDGGIISNYWDSKSDDLSVTMLKKHRKLRLKGLIDKNQKIEVLVGYDNLKPSIVGTIRGDADYVDRNDPKMLGSGMVGSDTVGGGTFGLVSIIAYPYYTELKLKTSKFELRTIRFEAKDIGYASVNFIEDNDILTYEDRISKRHRLKQNVNLAGDLTNQ